MKLTNKNNRYLNKKIFVKNLNGKNIFSIRDIGDIPKVRAKKFYSHEPDTVNWISKFPRNSKFLDIGANIGVYSLYAAHKNCKCISIEPQSLNFALLNLNIFDNKFQNLISAYPICANDKSGPSYLYHSKELKFGGAHTTFDRNINDEGRSFDIKFKSGSYAVVLDDFLKKIKFKPNFIKIDVDGNELNVLKGLKKTIKSKVLKSILIEINPNFKEHKKCVEILSKEFSNYKKVNIIKNNNIHNIIFSKI
jgi:FkbM family methyltransferase